MLALCRGLPPLAKKTFRELGGGAFCACFNKIFCEPLFKHGAGVFFHRLVHMVFMYFLQSPESTLGIDETNIFWRQDVSYVRP